MIERYVAYDVVALPAELLPGRRFTITTVVRDEVGIRIEYAIGGPLIGPEDDICWFGERRDDVGNTYEDLGGAYGPSDDGTRTEGVITMPLPQEEATCLRVRFSPRGDALSVRSAPAYELVVRLR